MCSETLLLRCCLLADAQCADLPQCIGVLLLLHLFLPLFKAPQHFVDQLTSRNIMQMQRCSTHAGLARVCSSSRRAAVQVHARATAVSAAAKVVVREHGSASLRGTVRKVNEDRFDIKVGGWMCRHKSTVCVMCVLEPRQPTNT